MNTFRFSRFIGQATKLFFFCFIFVAFSLFSCNLFSQQVVNNITSQKGWTTNNPFHTDVFVENYGQFDCWAKHSEQIKYAINNSDKIFFTRQGVIFRLDKIENISEEEREHSEPNESEDTTHKVYFVTMNWEGCNPDAEIIVSDISEGYYTFGEKGYENIKAKGYKKLTYKNIYPGIDAEYTIPEKGGIKYKIIVQPGSDISLVKMHYSGDVESLSKDKDGNILIQTEAGDIIDHAPVSFFQDNNEKMQSAFEINNNTVSFSLDQLRKTNYKLRTLVIDPWTTTPTSLSTNNAALDIDYDYYGNVFISGGTVPFKLSKYSANGVLLWTFTNPTNWSTSNCYSKFCLLPNSGTSFIGEPLSYVTLPRIMKIKTNGVLVHTSPGFGANDEIWEMFYNNCSKQLIAFGGATNSFHNIKLIADTNLSNCISKSFDGISSAQNDIVSAKMENNGDFYALVSSQNNYSGQEGHLKKSLFSTNYSPPCTFDVQTNYYFDEIHDLLGISGYALTVRANALALNNSYIFSYDGRTLNAWNKLNGSLLASIIVDNSYLGGLNRFHEGIDVDQCNTVYVGGTNQVHVYSFNGSSFTTLPVITANIPGNVHDIKVNSALNKIYICGVGFVTEAIAPISCSGGQIATTLTVDSCGGNICLTASGGTPPYYYQWNNGVIGNCLTNVTSGVYIVTVTDNSCTLLNHIDTVDLSSVLQLTITPGNPAICSGDSITLHVASNMSSTNFIWSNGSTASSINIAPTITTTYTVTGNNNTCNNTAQVIVTVNNSSNSTLHPIICQGSFFAVGPHVYVNSGTYIDTLSTNQGCDSIITTNLTVNSLLYSILNPVICQGQSFSIGSHVYTISGTYLDTLSTYQGCDSIITTNLIVNPVQHTIVNPVICQGQSYTVGNHIYTISGSYQDTLSTNHGCDSIITTNLIVSPVQHTILNPVLCQGQSYTVGSHVYTISGSYQDTLNTNHGCDSIITTNLIVNAVQQNILNPVICQGESFTVGSHVYTISGTYHDTLSTYQGCDSVITTNLTVNPVIYTTLNPVICLGDTLILGNNNYTASGIYIDTLTTINNCDSIVTINLNVKTIISNTSGSVRICRGEAIVLFASGGTSYYWIPPTWLNNPYSPTPLANPDSTITYFVTINDGACFVIDSVNVFVGCPIIYFPNSFTPNGDQTNDMFFAKGENIKSFSMFIFNRWGEQIFRSNDLSKYWDGKFNGKECPEAVYTYSADITFTTGDKLIKRGSVILVR